MMGGNPHSDWDPYPEEPFVSDQPTKTSPISTLKSLLGSDWTWDRDVVAALDEGRHAGGLWFQFSYLDDISFSGLEREIANAILDEIENGTKGRIVVAIRQNKITITKA